MNKVLIAIVLIAGLAMARGSCSDNYFMYSYSSKSNDVCRNYIHNTNNIADDRNGNLISEGEYWESLCTNAIDFNNANKHGEIQCSWGRMPAEQKRCDAIHKQNIKICKDKEAKKARADSITLAETKAQAEAQAQAEATKLEAECDAIKRFKAQVSPAEFERKMANYAGSRCDE
jgi:hypothetical protein